MHHRPPSLKLILATTALLAAGLAGAAGDVGILDRLSGDVSVVSSSGNSFRATAFMKVREGDVLKLPAGSEAQIVYFEAKRRELWKGPSSFKAGTEGSASVTGKAASTSEAKGVPSRESIAPAGNVQRMGSLTLRSPRAYPDDAAIAKARADYEKWVAAADADDILPELAMIGLLRDRQQPELLEPYLNAMLRKQPKRAEVKALVEQYRAPSARP
jgi:hypothetical protein